LCSHSDSKFAGFIPYAQFELIMNSLERFELLAIRKAPHINNVTDSIFIYKPNRHNNFKIGCHAYWAEHKKHYDDKYDEEEEEETEEYRTIQGLRI